MADPRLEAFLDEAGGDALLTADPGLVRLLAGHVADVGSGPSPFALPAMVVADRNGDVLLVCSEDESPGDSQVFAYEGFTIGPLDPVAGAASALRRALRSAGVKGRRLLVDESSVPAGIAAEAGGQAAPVAPLQLLCAVKTEADIQALESAIALCDAGQAAARRAASAGATELELWAAVTAAVERAAGGRVTMIADLVSGPRTADIGGAPEGRALDTGDLVLCDLVPRSQGMWGDSCSTFSVGDAPQRAADMHTAAIAALEAGLDVLRPGAVAGDVDTAVRSCVSEAGLSYPHHTGHGVGFHWHEEPRIVPGGRTVLEEGMVVALEPGAYEDGLGVRVERVAVVTADGGRVLSGHSLDLGAGDRS